MVKLNVAPGFLGLVKLVSLTIGKNFKSKQQKDQLPYK